MSDKEELSKDEIDDLLNSLDDEDVSEQRESPATSEAEEEEPNQENMRIYDFLRPQFLNQQELDLLQGRLSKSFRDSSSRFSAATGSEISFSVESVDVLTLHEYVRILPQPCAVVKALFPSGNYLAFEIALPAARTMKNLLLGIKKADNTDAAFSPVSAAVFSAGVKHFFIPPFAPGAQKLEFISDPKELVITTLLEMCLIVTATISVNDEKQHGPFSSQLSVMIPRETLMELHPDVFQEYVRPAQPRYAFSARQNSAERDIWFKRCYEFPLPNVDVAAMKQALETGSMDIKSTIRGRTVYREY